MYDPETHATLSARKGSQTKQKHKTEKTKNMTNSDPTKSQMLMKVKQILFSIKTDYVIIEIKHFV